jgi:Protein of unknown function (DUF2442)
MQGVRRSRSTRLWRRRATPQRACHAHSKREVIARQILSNREEHDMNTSPQSVKFDEDSMWVELTDGRALGIPLAWFPKLLNASLPQRHMCEISVNGLHWDALDEDIYGSM